MKRQRMSLETQLKGVRKAIQNLNRHYYKNKFPSGFNSCFTNSGSCFILQVLYLRTLGIFSVVSRGDVFEGKCRKMLCMDLQVIG